MYLCITAQSLTLQILFKVYILAVNFFYNLITSPNVFALLFGKSFSCCHTFKGLSNVCYYPKQSNIYLQASNFCPCQTWTFWVTKYDTRLHMAMCLLKGPHKARFTNSPVSPALHPTLVDTVSPCLFDHHLTTNLHSTNHSVNQDCLKSLLMVSQIHCKFLQDGSLYYPQQIAGITGVCVCVCVCVCHSVTQSCLTHCDPMDYSPRDSSVHGILQDRILQ